MNFLKGVMKFYRTFLLAVLLSHAMGLVCAQPAQAQVEDDYFEDEEEPYDEPYIEPAQPSRPPPDNMGQMRRDRGVTPPGPSPAPMPAPSMPPRGGGSSSSATGSESIEFRLVDPPKYWKPKKRKFQFQKKASQQPSAQKSSR